MMVTALISVARKERQAAHHGMRRRARKKSSVACCSRLKMPPIRTRAASDAARMAKSGHVSADPADSAMGSRHYGPHPRDRRRITRRPSVESASAGRRMSRAGETRELGLVAADEADPHPLSCRKRPSGLARDKLVLDVDRRTLG